MLSTTGVRPGAESPAVVRVLGGQEACQAGEGGALQGAGQVVTPARDGAVPAH